MLNLQQIRHLPLNPMALALRLVPAGGRLLMLLLAALVSLLLLTLLSPGLKTLEESLGALGWTLSPETTPEERITVVSIDEKSIAEIGPWPWSREQMAELVTAVDDAGAQLQLHDINYLPRPDDEGDAFVAALQNARGVVLAQVPVLESNQALQTGVMTHPMQGIACNTTSAVTQFASTQDFLAPSAAFSSIAKGHITAIVSADGAIRKIPAVICVDNTAYPALALSALLKATNSQDWSATVQAGGSLFGPAQVLRLNSYPGLDIPLDAEGNLRISYARAPSAFRSVSAVDVINGNIPAGILDGTWALIGATAFGMDDIVPTPYNGATPGVELNVRLLGSMLDAAMPYTPAGSAWLLGLLCLLFSGLLYVLATARGRSAAFGLPVAAILLPVAALALHIELLNSLDIWLGWVFPAIYGAFAASLLLLLELGRVRVERSRVFGNLSSYLPSDIAKEIAYSLPNSAINARRSDVTLLNADLRNFSAFGEARPPEESAAVLHFFFTRATEIVEQHGGRIHEFRGDGLLAVWDGNNGDVAAQALQSAHDMQAALHHTLLPEHAPAGLEPLGLGIGIEQGPALIGSIGPAHRRTHTLLGDTVGITLRIQEMTAELAQPILIGECAARQLSDQNLESQGSYLLAGLKIPHVLFAPAPTEAARPQDQQETPALKLVTGGRQ